MNLANGTGHLYFGGDMFVSQADPVDLPAVLGQAFGDGTFIGNLEGVPNFYGTMQSKAVPLMMNESVAGDASAAGIFYSLVNNHTNDAGVPAFEELVRRLGKSALLSRAHDTDPRCEVAGEHVLFFADEREECPWTELDFLRFDRSIITKAARFITDSIVVVHGGLEYREYPTPYQRRLAMELIDAGAKAVLFHHSHVKGHYEMYRDRLIHYGLGNFYFSAVSGLHGLKSINGCVLRYDRASGVFSSADIRYEDAEQESTRSIRLALDFAPLGTGPEFPPLNEYRSWYRSQYPLDGSVRPRQLYASEAIIRAQYRAWYSIASPLVKMGVTGRVKKLVAKLLPGT